MTIYRGNPFVTFDNVGKWSLISLLVYFHTNARIASFLVLGHEIATNENLVFERSIRNGGPNGEPGVKTEHAAVP